MKLSPLKSFVAATALTTALGGCVETAGPSSYAYEGQNGATYRAPIQQQPVNCTTTTRERGTVSGLYTSYGTGSAERTCVYSDYPSQRRAGTNPIEEVTNTVNDIYILRRSLQRLGL